MVAVFAAVFHQGGPRAAPCNGVPHVPKGFRRHVGVTHHVVGLTQQLLAAKAADFHKVVVAVSDAAFKVGDRYQSLIGGEVIRLAGHGLVVSHEGR